MIRGTTVRVTWKGKKTLEAQDKKVKVFLQAAGNLIVNQMVENSHVITGTLRNSMNYRLHERYGSMLSTKHGDGAPPKSAKVSNASKTESVRAGSALVYAGPQERHNGWASKTFDEIRRQVELLAARVFKI